MKIICIIAEYNPFHNGHLHQISKTRELFGKDCAIIAIMSGNFVQRGEPAVLDKWARTNMALAAGVNLVIELPTVYATASAELFADGGVSAAIATGICDYLIFGSESGDIDQLFRIATVLANEPPEYKESLKNYLDLGNSFPISRSLALADYMDDLEVSKLLSFSNNILAIEYLKSLIRRNPNNISPITFKREGSSYTDISFDTSGLSSATAIREYLQMPNLDSKHIITGLKDSMPIESLAILTHRYRASESVFSQEAFACEIFSSLISSSKDYLSQISGMGEGLGNRLKKLALNNGFSNLRLSQLIDAGASKRYPKSRVRRALLALLLGITTKDTNIHGVSDAPFYLRILGFDKKGRYLLKLMRKMATLPIISIGSDFKEFSKTSTNELLLRVAQIDISSTDIWSQKTSGICGRDFKTLPISFPR